MATCPLTAAATPPVQPAGRAYLAWREPGMTEADSFERPETDVVRTFGVRQWAELLERTFAQRVGASFAVAMASRDVALRLSLTALGIGAGDDVVVPAITSIATANTVLQVGANPVLADVDPTTHVLTPETVGRVRTTRTRAVIVTHLCGRAANLQGLESLAQNAGLTLVNDAGLGVEMQHGGRNISQYGALSVYGADAARQGRNPEGGIIATSNAVLADRLAQLRRGHQPDRAMDEEADGPGCGFRMAAGQASLGLRYLAHIDAINTRRRVIWSRYEEALASLPLLRPAPLSPGDRHALGIYAVQVGAGAIAGGRDEMALALHRARIGTGVHYRGVHLHPRYREGLGYTAADFPTATRISSQTLSLPLSAAMTDRDVEDVIISLTDILESGRQ